MSERDEVVEILRKAIAPPFKATMGRGDGTIVVDGRSGYVWVRKVGKTELLIQAYNRGAPAIEDVVVLVQQSKVDGIKGYEVVGVIPGGDTPSPYPEVPPHAWTHEWRPGIGRDRVTVYPRAWGYLRAEPVETGSINVYVSYGWLYHDGEYIWYPGGYSPGFSGPSVPTGVAPGYQFSWYQTLYMNPSDQSLHIINGVTGIYGENIPPAPSGCMLPICAVESTGTFAAITENMIEDIRLFMDLIEDCYTGTGDGGIGVHTHADNTQGGQLDWDDIWADDIHDHSGPGEGGQIDLTDIIDSQGQLLTGPQRTDLTDGGITALHQHAGAATSSVLVTLMNRTGGPRLVNDVVVTDPGNDESFTGTAVEGYAGKILIVAETIDSLATGTLWERGGPFDINVEGVVTWNDGLRTSGTPYWAEAAPSPTGTGVFAIALSTSAGPTGTISALFLDEVGAVGDGGGAGTIEIQEDDIKVVDASIVNFEGGGGKVTDEGGGKVTVNITPGGNGGATDVLMVQIFS